MLEKNPFTHTPGRVGDANVSTYLEENIYDNFMHDIPSENVYKIIGIRGSGKTVLYGNIIRHYKSEEQNKDGWIVYDLSSARNPINTLISYMMLEKEVQKALRIEKLPSSITISTPIGGLGASRDSNREIDDEVRLEQLVGILVKKGKRILIGIDDIAKTNEVTQFCSVYAKLIRNVMDNANQTPWPVYLICSGVYQNFYELGEVNNLTFFKRAAEVKTEPLAIPAMSIRYEELLNIDEKSAIEYAKLSKGFAYAYQVIGGAYFQYKDKGWEYVLKHAKSELFSQCYEKIWKELPNGQKEILRAVSDGPKPRKEILSGLKTSVGSYQVNSNLLKKMGLLVDSSKSYGYAEITLPFFGEYIQKYDFSLIKY